MNPGQIESRQEENMNPSSRRSASSDLAWLHQLDPSLLALNRANRSDFIKEGDVRPRCEAWTNEPAFGHLCANLAKDGTQFCLVHREK